jgi:hypothetical protein
VSTEGITEHVIQGCHILALLWEPHSITEHVIQGCLTLAQLWKPHSITEHDTKVPHTGTVMGAS